MVCVCSSKERKKNIDFNWSDLEIVIKTPFDRLFYKCIYEVQLDFFHRFHADIAKQTVYIKTSNSIIVQIDGLTKNLRSAKSNLDHERKSIHWKIKWTFGKEATVRTKSNEQINKSKIIAIGIWFVISHICCSCCFDLLFLHCCCCCFVSSVGSVWHA